MLSAELLNINMPSLQAPGDIGGIVNSVTRCNTLRGDMAEVGVYRGGSARHIVGNTTKDVHLFDTFTGLPEDEGMFHKGDYPSDFETVKRLFEPYPNVYLHKGVFPDTAKDLASLEFCFVHIDCDLSKYIKLALEFFWPKLVPGGRVVVHDASNKNVRGAVRSFFYGQANRKSDIKSAGDQLVFSKVK